MAITVTAGKSTFDVLKGKEDLGFYIVEGTMNLGTYATGGVAVAASDLDADASSIDRIICGLSEDMSTLYGYDETNGKIVAVSAVGTEVTNSTDLGTDSTKHCPFIAIVS